MHQILNLCDTKTTSTSTKNHPSLHPPRNKSPLLQCRRGSNFHTLTHVHTLTHTQKQPKNLSPSHTSHFFPMSTTCCVICSFLLSSFQQKLFYQNSRYIARKAQKQQITLLKMQTVAINLDFIQDFKKSLHRHWDLKTHNLPSGSFLPEHYHKRKTSF